MLILSGLIASGQQVKRGPRKTVDLDIVPDSAFYPGKIFIKIKAGFENKLATRIAEDRDGNFKMGIPNLDDVNKQLHIKGIRRSFEMVLGNASKESKHKAWNLHQWYTIELPAKTNIKAAIAKLKSLSAVIEEAEPSYKRVLYDNNDPVQLWTPADSAFYRQWHFNHTAQEGPTSPVGVDADIDLPEAWDLEKGKSGVIVAVLDGGIDTSHPDLRRNLWIGPNGERFGYNWNDNSPLIAANKHGTHTSGTIGAINNNTIGVSGIAGGDGSLNSGIRLMSMQIFDGSGNVYAGDDAVANAFVYSADHGAAIAQNSWGGGEFSSIITDAIDYFIMNGGGTVLNGGIVFFSAGNDGTETENFPGNYPPVIAVAATNYDDKKCSYSNYGDWIDISAPGGESTTRKGILSTVPASSGALYAWNYGTSMACPHVSGIAALCISKSPGRLSNEQLRKIILQSADDIYPLNPTYVGKLGSGRANAFNAVQTAAIAAGMSVDSVSQFKAAQSCGEATLSWYKNPAGNNVIIAESDTLLFGTPSGVLSVNDALPGGGTIIYKGNVTSLTRQIPVNAKKYYRIWSYSGTNYSFHKTTAVIYSLATTLLTLENNSGCDIKISWGDNMSCLNDSVLLVANNNPSFGIPTDVLTLGDIIPGGGKVIYKGKNNSYLYTTDLDSTVYIQKWNFNGSHQYTNSGSQSYDSVSKSNSIASINAIAIGSSSINIKWTPDQAAQCFNGTLYMLAYSAEGKFGIPTGIYTAGATIDGGGAVVYIGTSANFDHTGLAENTAYCYRIWEINARHEYSSGKQVCSRTLCSNAIITLPYQYGFNGKQTTTPDICQWELVNNTENDNAVQVVASGENPIVKPVEGSGMLRFQAYNIPADRTAALVSRGIKKGIGQSMDLRFRWYQDSSAYTDDSYKAEGVTVLWSNDKSNWQTLEFYPRVPVQGLAGWSFKQITLPATSLNADTVYLSFLFNSGYGNNCYLDDLSLKVSSYKPSDGATTTAVCESTDSSTMWTNYYDSMGDRLLSIKKNNQQIGKAGQANFILKVGGTNEATAIVPAANYVTNPGGWLAMKRYYSFKPVSEPAGNINIRFYYFTGDLNALATAANSLTPPGSSITYADLYAWKINNIAAAYDPDPAAGHVAVPLASNYNKNGYTQYVNASSPDTTTWQYKDLGNNLHSIEYTVQRSGGGGLGIGSVSGKGALQILNYTFTGSGNWSNSSNWLNSNKPPVILPANGRILINPASTGECVLDIQQTIPAGAELIINAGKKLTIKNGLQVKH